MPPKVRVVTSKKLPSFATFLWKGEEELGLNKYCYTLDGSRANYREKGGTCLRVVPGEDGLTHVFVSVHVPPTETPAWLEELLGKYQVVLDRWESGADPRVEVTYVYV